MDVNFADRTIVRERSNYIPKWPQEEFIVPLLEKHILALLEQFANPDLNGRNILDVGCGRQPFRTHCENLGYRYRSMDIQQNPETNVDYLCAIDDDLPVAMKTLEQFNFLLCTEVLEHVANWDVAFENLGRLTAPSGLILITCPHFYQLHEEPYDFWRPTMHALKFFAKKNNLRIVHEEAAGDAWDVLGTLLANTEFIRASDHIMNKVFGKIASNAKYWIFKYLKTRKIQRHILAKGPLYISNILLLEKI